jgi:anti-sigma factor ChrR (cupin superfamily)
MTTARTPNVKQHEQLPPLASRFVDTAALPWTKTAYPGVEAKTLLVDRNSGLLTVLLKMAPNARLPDHEHVLIEQTYLLEGTLICGEGTVTPGNFVWRPAGSRHEAWAGPEGNLSVGARRALALQRQRQPVADRHQGDVDAPVAAQPAVESTDGARVG